MYGNLRADLEHPLVSESSVALTDGLSQAPQIAATLGLKFKYHTLLYAWVCKVCDRRKRQINYIFMGSQVPDTILEAGFKH